MKRLLIAMTVIFIFFSAGCRASGKMGKSDLVFIAGGSEFRLDTDVSSLIAFLGGGYAVSEAPSCVYEGTDKTFAYDGIEIYTYPYDGKDLIDEIVLLSPDYMTNRGIKPGDDIDAVLEEYGDSGIKEGNMLTYYMDPGNSGGPVLYFMLDESRVVSIHYYSASNITGD